MRCNTFEFSISGKISPELALILKTLRRRGAFLSHQYSIYKYGVSINGYRVNIPAELPWEPFRDTLRDSGLLHGLKPGLIEMNVLPPRDR